MYIDDTNFIYKMDSDEHNRLLTLLNSIEKEVLQEERDAERDRETLRRQLFDDVENSGEAEKNDFVVEREGSDQSADDVHYSLHDTNSDKETQDEAERAAEVEVTNENYILGKDNQTKWNVHTDSSNLRGECGVRT